MLKLTVAYALSVCTALAAGLLQAQEQQDEQLEEVVLQSDWLELKQGYRGSTLGAELMEIEDDGEANMQKVTVAIPKSAMAHPDDIEEVVVIGQRPEKWQLPELEPLDIEYEWVQDYDPDSYGLVIRLRRNTNWPIRIYMNSDSGFNR